ncbi:signal peptidase II [Ligilactobacillus salivarius]|uniref:signal peptidase II n=1 Tax=Ligilactobacillus salivarius TaxID=1624 RepID=UPI0009DA1A7C|nr:signal peptidase II [Ligilactobacillus salivarius]OQQ81421.1 signal peptidase II [Ligilactobacillus salivarius]
MWLYIPMIIILIIADQGLKLWISANIKLGTSQVILPNILALTNVRNDGAAWSVLSGQQWFFTVITIVALGMMGYFFWKLRNDNLYMLAISLLIAGTLGNFIDRIRLGYVVDMFETLFMNFPIFNVADMCLTFGVIIVIIALIRDEKDE